jgi:cytochrome P450
MKFRKLYKKLCFLQTNCVNEMRFCHMFRCCRCGSEDIEYVKGMRKFRIPRGTHIQLGLFQLHRSDEHWTNPLEFNPDRFICGAGGGGTLKSYQPFGNGPRSCIGERYSFLVIKLMLANLLFNYKLERCPETEDEIQLKFKTATMTPLNGSFARPTPVSNPQS